MKQISVLFFAFIFSFCTVTAHAQTTARSTAASNSALNAAFAKIFGNNSAFIAKADIRIYNGKATSELFRIPASISFLSDAMRVDANVMQFRGSGFTPEVAAQLQRLGLESIVCLLKLNGANVQMIYPSAKSVVEVPIPSDALLALKSKAKVEAVPLAHETIGKHACVKNKVTVFGRDGASHVFVVWNSTDQNNFPARLETTDEGQRFVIDFTEVKLVKPDVKQFGIPAGFQRYTDMGEFQQAMVKRALLGR